MNKKDVISLLDQHEQVIIDKEQFSLASFIENELKQRRIDFKD